MLDPEPKDMYHCHPYHVLEIYKPPVNEPIGSYQIQHLKILYVIGPCGLVKMGYANFGPGVIPYTEEKKIKRTFFLLIICLKSINLSKKEKGRRE